MRLWNRLVHHTSKFRSFTSGDFSREKMQFRMTYHELFLFLSYCSKINRTRQSSSYMEPPPPTTVWGTPASVWNSLYMVPTIFSSRTNNTSNCKNLIITIYLSLINLIRHFSPLNLKRFSEATLYYHFFQMEEQDDNAISIIRFLFQFDLSVEIYSQVS